ncbi:MAG: hypothetical protein KDD88_07360, partial [Rhodobacteraceae bacterium]|nr:hypothetical protein [Paracoccaceae bacterium]
RIAVPSWRAPAAGPAPAETATPLSRDEIAALLHGVLREWPRGRAALTEAERGQARVAGHLRSALYPGWHRKRSG